MIFEFTIGRLIHFVKSVLAPHNQTQLDTQSNKVIKIYLVLVFNKVYFRFSIYV